MLGQDEQQLDVFSYISPEQRVPQDHPLRALRNITDEALRELQPRFRKLYANTGRPSIAPEKLLRALLLQALYSVRSERLLMEQLDYNLLFRWFVGLNMDDAIWRPELLFVLQQEVEMYDTYQKRITECDQRLQKQLASFTDTLSLQPPEEKPKTKKPAAKNAPRFDLSSELQRVTGVDLTRIDGIDVMVAQTLLSEVGLDMSRWKTESHFASWLGLCPDNRISGDKVLGRGTRRVVNRAATALRQAANTLMRNRSYLGAQYHRLRTRLGAPKAITAMAHRLARLVYRMLKYGQAYVDKGTEYYEERFRQQQIHLLRKRAAKLGLQVAEIHT